MSNLRGEHGQRQRLSTLGRRFNWLGRGDLRLGVPQNNNKGRLGSASTVLDGPECQPCMAGICSSSCNDILSSDHGVAEEHCKSTHHVSSRLLQVHDLLFRMMMMDVLPACQTVCCIKFRVFWSINTRPWRLFTSKVSALSFF